MAARPHASPLSIRMRSIERPPRRSDASSVQYMQCPWRHLRCALGHGCLVGTTVRDSAKRDTHRIGDLAPWHMSGAGHATPSVLVTRRRAGSAHDRSPTVRCRLPRRSGMLLWGRAARAPGQVMASLAHRAARPARMQPTAANRGRTGRSRRSAARDLIQRGRARSGWSPSAPNRPRPPGPLRQPRAHDP